MNRLKIVAVAAGIVALGACNNSASEQKADNIEANAEMKADNMEEAADNMSSETASDAMENKADVTREKGEEKADATRTSADIDGNSADDTTSGNSAQKTR